MFYCVIQLNSGVSIHVAVSCDVEEICNVSAGINDFGDVGDFIIKGEKMKEKSQ